MVSVDGLLDGHEVAVRARVEELREEAARVAAALSEAETALEHVAITRATLTAVLAGQVADCPIPSSGTSGSGGPATVPAWHPELGVDHLPVEYRRVFAAVAAVPGGVRAKALAIEFGLAPVPAKVEGMRSKLKRLVGRGWLAECAPGRFTVIPAAALGPVAGS